MDAVRVPAWARARLAVAASKGMAGPRMGPNRPGWAVAGGDEPGFRQFFGSIGICRLFSVIRKGLKTAEPRKRDANPGRAPALRPESKRQNRGPPRLSGPSVPQSAPPIRGARILQRCQRLTAGRGGLRLLRLGRVTFLLSDLYYWLFRNGYPAKKPCVRLTILKGIKGIKGIEGES